MLTFTEKLEFNGDAKSLSKILKQIFTYNSLLKRSSIFYKSNWLSWNPFILFLSYLNSIVEELIENGVKRVLSNVGYNIRWEIHLLPSLT